MGSNPLEQLWDDELAGAKASCARGMKRRGVPDEIADAIAETLYGTPPEGCTCNVEPWWEDENLTPCPVHGSSASP